MRDYLGDGVYVEWVGFALALRADSPDSPHVIHLDPEVLTALNRFAARCAAQPAEREGSSVTKKLEWQVREARLSEVRLGECFVFLRKAEWENSDAAGRSISKRPVAVRGDFLRTIHVRTAKPIDETEGDPRVCIVSWSEVEV